MTSLKTSKFLDRFDFKETYLASRQIKAGKILRFLRREIPASSEVSLLDIGCSRGQITTEMAKHFRFVVGVDAEVEAPSNGGRACFLQADGALLPFSAGAFDVVLLNHVLEHVPSAAALLSEVLRVLKPGGLCYLACPNRFCLVEPHYRLPFLSWLPRSLADRYVCLRKPGERYLDNLPSFWTLQNLTCGFEAEHMTVQLLKEPEVFCPGDVSLQRKLRWISWLPTPILKLMLPWVPVFIVLLRKPHAAAREEAADVGKG